MKNSPESDFTVELLMGLLMSVLAGFLVSMLLALLVMFLPGLSQAAMAADTIDQEMIRKNDVTSGSVLLRTEKRGMYRLAPILKTDVHMRVNGMLVRTRVVQRFSHISG